MTKRDSKSGSRSAQVCVCQQRRIKVGGFHYPARLGDSPYRPRPPVPWLQLKGLWLKQAGFEVDTTVTVRVMEGCLVVMVAS